MYYCRYQPSQTIIVSHQWLQLTEVGGGRKGEERGKRETGERWRGEIKGERRGGRIRERERERGREGGEKE